MTANEEGKCTMSRKVSEVATVSGTILVIVAMVMPVAAGAADSGARVTILERGLYEARSGEYCDHSGPTLTISNVSDAHLHRSTDSIPARRDTRFGMRYRLDSPQNRGPVAVRMVTRFPLGGLVDERGKHRIRNEYVVSVQPGVVQYRDYTLGEDFEVIPGLWTFEFWQGEQKLGEQTFCLYDNEPDAANGCRVPNS